VGSKYLYGGKNRTMIKSIYKENIYESNEEDIKNEDNYVWDEPYVKKTDVIGITHTKCGSHYPATMKTFNKGYDTCFTCKAMLGKNVKWTKTKLDNLIEFLSGDSLEIVSEYKGTKSLLTFRHKTCNTEFDSTLHKYIRFKTKCPTCEPEIKERIIWDNEKLDEYIKDNRNDYERLTEVDNGRKTRMKLLHKDCGEVWDVTLDSFLCDRSHCKRIEKFTLDDLNNLDPEYRFIGEYINVGTPIEVEHLKCGYKWKCRVYNFRDGTRCPKCRGGVSYDNKEFDRLLYETHQDDYIRVGEYVNTQTKVSIKHIKCNKVYEVRPYLLLSNMNRGCPYCAGNKKKTSEEFDSDMIENGITTFKRISPYINNSTPLNFKCNICDEEFSGYPGNILYQGQKCPGCNPKTSLGERLIENLLIENDIPYETQKKFDECIYKRELPFDFFIDDKVLIEFDGEQHYRPSFGEKSFENQVIRDNLKNKFSEEFDIPLVRIRYSDIEIINDILKEVVEYMNY
jgi:Zn-finger nucleic acid-binding protein